LAEKRPAAEQESTPARPALDELARSLHASFLNRWGRHDPAGFERALAKQSAQDSRTTVA
jgi:hypothetical protein